MRHTYTLNPPSTIAPNKPGAQTPKVTSKYPPKVGPITRVRLSMDVEKPMIPPTSSVVTALVNVEVRIVFKRPPGIEIAVMMTNKTGTEGANAHPSRPNVIMIMQMPIRMSSR